MLLLPLDSSPKNRKVLQRMDDHVTSVWSCHICTDVSLPRNIYVYVVRVCLYGALCRVQFFFYFFTNIFFRKIIFCTKSKNHKTANKFSQISENFRTSKIHNSKNKKIKKANPRKLKFYFPFPTI